MLKEPSSATQQSSSLLIWVIVMLIVMSSSELGKAQFVVKRCGLCNCRGKSIICSTKRYDLSAEPTLDKLLPSRSAMYRSGLDVKNFDTVKVECEDKMIRKLKRLDFDRFRNLLRLDLLNCEVETLDSDLFELVPKLNYLNMCNNKLKLIESGALKNMNKGRIILRSNMLSNFSSDLLDGLHIKSLELDRNRIQNFPSAMIEGLVKLDHLSLSRNNVSKIDHRAKRIIRGLKSFQISYNPLECSCETSWLSEVWKVTSDLKNTRCQTPLSLRGRRVMEVNKSEVTCRPASITSVELDMRAATPLAQPPEGSYQNDFYIGDIKARVEMPPLQTVLSWNFRHLDHNGEVRGAEVSSDSTSFKRAISLRQSPAHTAKGRQQYLLTAVAYGGHTSTVNITLPNSIVDLLTKPRLTSPSTLTFSPTSTSSSSSSSPSHAQGIGGSSVLAAHPDHYYSDKQFTLVEMIVAVIGTFMSTTLLFLVSCQFTRWYSRRDRKRWEQYSSHQSTYNYNQNQSSASHEYDVPRMDQPCLPQLPSAASASASGEFLDFTNPRVTYNV